LDRAILCDPWCDPSNNALAASNEQQPFILWSMPQSPITHYPFPIIVEFTTSPSTIAHLIIFTMWLGCCFSGLLRRLEEAANRAEAAAESVEAAAAGAAANAVAASTSAVAAAGSATDAKQSADTAHLTLKDLKS
jgi:hypothetical protein